jgi:UDPglucose 6-dehydrogenase
VRELFNTVADKKIAVLGFAFKKDTNDTRESPAIAVCRDLLSEDACVAVFDPKVSQEDIRRDLLNGHDNRRLTVADTAYAAAEGAHAVLVLTEWDEFKRLDFARIYAEMPKPAFVFDGRNILDLNALRQIGFKVFGVGKSLI